MICIQPPVDERHPFLRAFPKPHEKRNELLQLLKGFIKTHSWTSTADQAVWFLLRSVTQGRLQQYMQAYAMRTLSLAACLLSSFRLNLVEM